MATTRLMPLHTGKGRTVGTAIEAIIDYEIEGLSQLEALLEEL